MRCGRGTSWSDAGVSITCLQRIHLPICQSPADRPLYSALLARFGIKVQIHDERPDQTTVGRADGLQPKTIETFQMLRLGNDLLDTGVKVFDICMWSSEEEADGKTQLRRVGREVHYPSDAVDLLHPFILLCHQGMVEGMFIDDLRDSGVEVQRSSKFDHLTNDTTTSAVFTHPDGSTQTTLQTDYLVGCDGARSRVRREMHESTSQGHPHSSYWGVLDGELDTDFPDIWSKTVVYSPQHGSVLIIPRERNLTRLYIEVKNQDQSISETSVIEQARRIMAPYKLDFISVEWFGNYGVAQRVAERFADEGRHVFIAGDAAHTHSPKAAQGMNTSMHDSWNLGWKLNLAVRGLARREVLLGTYEEERRKIARDLIDFDYEHANSIAGGDAKALAENFRTNIGFISGVGAEYGENVVNCVYDGAGGAVLAGGMGSSGAARAGRNLPPAKVTRYIDDNPVDVQLDIPVLGQFRVFVVAPDVLEATDFLVGLSDAVLSPSSFIMKVTEAASRSYKQIPRPPRAKDRYYRPERYTALSELFTFGLISKSIPISFDPLLGQNPC